MDHQDGGHKYVIRIDSEGGRVLGWQVRLNRKENYLSKLFSDNVFGSKSKALAAAISYRNDVLEERREGLHTLEARVKVVLSSLPSNNTSGILGVSRCITNEKKWLSFSYLANKL